MKDGAKVLEEDEAPFEPERWRDIKELLGPGVASEEYDWWRLCVGLGPEEVGEDMIMDFGLPLGTFGPGDGDAVRENGLLRLSPALDAILQSVLEEVRDAMGLIIGTKEHQARETIGKVRAAVDKILVAEYR